MISNKLNVKHAVFAAAIGSVVALSGLSVSVFAQSTIAEQEGKVMTESKAPQELHTDFRAESSSASFPVSSSEADLPLNMSAEQSAPFIQAAAEALENINITLQEEGYTVTSSYYEGTGHVTVSWIPEAWDDLGPLSGVTGEAVFVTFADTDLAAGTGTVSSIRTVDGENITVSDDANTQTIKFTNVPF